MTTYTVARQGYGLHVHKLGCRDLTRVAGLDAWDVEADSLRDIVEDTYGPKAGGFYEEAGYVPGTPEYARAWEDYTGEFRVMPCAGRLPYEGGAA